LQGEKTKMKEREREREGERTSGVVAEILILLQSRSTAAGQIYRGGSSHINRASCFSKNTSARPPTGTGELRIRNFMRVCFTHGDTAHVRAFGMTLGRRCPYSLPRAALFVQKMD